MLNSSCNILFDIKKLKIIFIHELFLSIIKRIMELPNKEIIIDIKNFKSGIEDFYEELYKARNDIQLVKIQQKVNVAIEELNKDAKKNAYLALLETRIVVENIYIYIHSILNESTDLKLKELEREISKITNSLYDIKFFI